ncbi:hypothetical protein [Dactylosporangium matsuzakiense]|uniref:Uncharacterized protein n=1 Tax=Dactylosporangium matsuzakiense TaxID=53360 RepID=A0A9W6NJ27_9ACTN|nr:hypothetical protein [Dactylosporangium matsuzakiense]UWZ45396.1 hypothetical protein Dmats_02270 [Dactylosporangium matsuzakiense]GLK98617.1 hypothetical protein GCM10017581_003580 [Dactylosporangium matsuzakiense]
MSLDARSSGAAALLAALNEACEDFQMYGQQVAHAHSVPGSMHWELIGRIGRIGPGESPFALVGVVLRYERTTVDLGVDVWVRDGNFEVSGYATIDGRRMFIDLPDVLTDDVDEAIRALREYTRKLCAHRNVLEEVA